MQVSDRFINHLRDHIASCQTNFDQAMQSLHDLVEVQLARPNLDLTHVIKDAASHAASLRDVLTESQELLSSLNQ